MATYKVIQDIEAEDKLIGPLTLRQFIYAGIACLAAYLSFLAVTKGAAFMLVVLLPIVVTAGFFAFPWKGEQPTEIWALARIRFIIKPRKRIWDQSGTKELVTVTAPKHLQTEYTNGLDESEVRSRLKALADTIDSRGWAIKNANVNSYAPPLVMTAPSDRLLAPSTLPQEVDDIGVVAADDMLDERNNHVAQQVDTMIEASAKAHRQRIEESLQRPDPPQMPQAPKTPANNYWFLNNQAGPGQSASIPNDMVTFNTQVVTPEVQSDSNNPDDAAGADSMPDEEQLVETLKERKEQLPMSTYYGHLHTIQPLSAQSRQTPPQGQDQQQDNGTAPQPPNIRPYDEYADYTSRNASVAPPKPPGRPGDSPQGSYAGYSYPVPVGSPYDNSRQQGQTDDNGGTQQRIDRNQYEQGTREKAQPVTPSQQAAILQLANNDDLNVATIAREAQRSGLSDGEVVIKLH
jgi:hypothetical protein